MITMMIVVGDESSNLVFKVAWQEVVFQQHTVLQGLMPAFDLTPRMRMIMVFYSALLDSLLIRHVMGKNAYPERRSDIERRNLD